MAGYTKADMEEIYRQGVLHGRILGASGMQEEDVAEAIEPAFQAALRSLREEKPKPKKKGWTPGPRDVPLPGCEKFAEDFYSKRTR